MATANHTHLPVLKRDDAFLGFNTKRIGDAEREDWNINCSFERLVANVSEVPIVFCIVFPCWIRAGWNYVFNRGAVRAVCVVGLSVESSLRSALILHIRGEESGDFRGEYS